MASQEELDTAKLREAARKAAIKASKRPSSNNSTTTYVAVGAFGVVVAFVVGLLIFNPELPLSKIPVIDAEYIKAQNELKLGFTLAENELFKDQTLEFARRITQSGLSNNARNVSPCMSYQNEGEIVPSQYDLRTEREFCMLPAQSQGNCSSSYAFATVSVTAERLCMLTNGGFTDQLSVQDMISCSKRTQGCTSGNIDNAFNQIRENGVVDDFCFPYSSEGGEVTDCKAKCEGKTPYKLASVCATAGDGGLMREIKNNGPVVALIQVYSDFLVYKSGIYEPHITATRLPAIQAVEVVGWGVDEKEIQYWIIKNSWGPTWGEQGYGYVKKGVKDLGIEDFALTGTPVVPQAAEPVGDFENLETTTEE